MNIVLSSGFGNEEKLQAFLEDERQNSRLFESLGIGELVPSWRATADIVRANGDNLSKTGRTYTENPRLQRAL